LARLALLCAAGAVAVLAAVVGKGGALVLLAGLAGLLVVGAGTWWALAHRGVARAAGALIAVCAPAAVLGLYATTGLWLDALGALLLWSGALASARSALRIVRQPRRMHAVRAAVPLRPVLIMNPHSGGGKVERFALVEKAEALGARVLLLGPVPARGTDTPSSLGAGPAATKAATGPRIDVAVLARQAVAEGADLLGVAAGDGTQAQVAAVAAEHGLPFLVVSAGTRNHFAMDLGLDRADPSHCLEALTEAAEELRVDLGMVGDHPFVNTVSFGAYAEIVQSPAYRGDKAGTTLDTLPDLLLGEEGARLEAELDDGTVLDAQQAVLVSNNPYAGGDPLGAAGRRERLDRGVLGVVGVCVEGAAQAAELALLGVRASALHTSTAHRVVVFPTATTRTDTIPVAVDGEALRMTPPVVCTVRPRALRVRVPRQRPGAPVTNPPLDWRRIVALALGRPLPREEHADA
jgi:diacylglycerol kinase family enzyme